MSRSASKAARDLLLGMKELPEQGGGWGLLLRRGAQPAELPPKAHGAVQEINPAYLEFVPHASVSDRGMGVFYGLWFFLLFVFLFGPDTLTSFISGKSFGVAEFIIYGGTWVIGLSFGIWAYRSARMPLAPPVILSRTLRKFYCWVDRKRGWMVLDYDELRPAVFRSAIVTTAGSATFFILGLAKLVPGTRRIADQVNPAPLLFPAERPEEVWEFIRTYMDGAHEALPPVDPMPPLRDPRADHARMDRLLLQDLVDAHHRLKPGLLNKIYTWFWGGVSYWTERCALWVQRTAPRPAYPPELREAMDWQGDNPYRTRPPTDEERQAWEGRLPHLRRRWLAAAAFSTLIYGGMFLLMTVGAWLERGS
ncbi:hypothetical protein [Novilysobacter erysipheiresistens]|uniref:RDD family protein n=1 Tax=Novilysobacter erysipheiresistens TaxID=1749332 RepID=A0ABU7YYK2_9GAMM